MFRARLIVFTIIFILSSTYLFAQKKDAQKFTAEDPVLITSVGQSADILMVKILANKADLNFEFNKTATKENLKGIKSVILVCGGSTKGLGAAKINKEQEYARAEELINQVRKDKIKIIALHVGGKSRRGSLSDYFNKLAADNADHIIVVKAGDEDGFFSKIAKANKIQIDTPEKIVTIQDILKSIYSK